MYEIGEWCMESGAWCMDFRNIHTPRSRFSTVNYEKSIHHSPDFQQWIIKFYRSVIWVGEFYPNWKAFKCMAGNVCVGYWYLNPFTSLSLCNLDTTLITREIWKYLSRVAVFFETIHHSGCALVVYGFKKHCYPQKIFPYFTLEVCGIYYYTTLHSISHCSKFSYNISGAWCMISV